MTSKTVFHKAKPVVIFNSNRRLVATATSAYNAARLSGLAVGNISNVCNGLLMSLGGYYFRYRKDNVPLVESLEEYDRLCGLDRVYYKTNRMNRKNWRYKKKGD